MKTNARKQKRLERDAQRTEEKLHRPHLGLLDAATVSGAVAGAALGSIGGPPGMVAGGLVGTALGVLAGLGLDNAERRHDKRDKDLDDEIGVTKGGLGAASPDAPPATRGAYSGASAGVAPPSGTTSEGPMQGTDEE